jgi:hypothetical protein
VRKLMFDCGQGAATKSVMATALAFSIAIGLVGCGGGSSNSSTTANNSAEQGPTVSLVDAAAYLSQRSENRSFTVSGSRTDPAAPAGSAAIALGGSGTLTRDKATPTLFDGTPALKSTRVISGTVVAQGQSSPIDVTTVTYADPSSLATIARLDNGVTTRIAPYRLPSAVQIGSTGSLGTGSSDALPLGVSTTSYAIGRDTSTSVLLTVVDTVAVAGVPVTDVRTVTRIHLDGSAELVSITTERFNLGRLFETVVLTFG